MTVEELRTALSTLGAECGQAIGLDADGACTLPFGDGGALHLQLREDVGELDFVALLGEIPPDIRAAVFESMLSANYYWRETFGATLAWQADFEQAVLAYPLRLNGLDEPSLRTALDEFVSLAETWTKRLARDVAEARARDDDEEDEADAEHKDGEVVFHA